MARIRCFLLEETERVAVYFRRYNSTAFKKGTCPVHDDYHNASVRIEDELVEKDERGYIVNGSKPASHDDPRWPKICACGYIFRPEDEWQRDAHLLYWRRDTGEEMILRNAPPGAMWYAWWFDDIYQPQGKHCLVIRMPGGGEWIVDSQAKNCSMPEDRKQEKHHCWILHGDPPNVTVDKQGASTCAAGSGSVQMQNWHGFLRNGFLEE
jgi:hypothetical protein